MNYLMKRSPSLHGDFESLFEGLLDSQVSKRQWIPSCEIEEGKSHYLLHLDVPGLRKEDIKIAVENDNLVISGERKSEQASSTYSERRYGRFERAFSLGKGVSTEKIEAEYKDGTLSIYLPKSESTKPKQIEVRDPSEEGFFAKLLKKKENDTAA